MKMNCWETEAQRVGTRRSGFTILELVVAMALIGLLVLTVYGAITSGMGTMRMARENLRATQLLVEKMETIRLYDWDELNTNFIPTQFIVNYDVNSASTNSGILYYGTVAISPAATGASYDPDMKQVSLSLRWKTGALVRSRDLTTYVCRSGVQNYIY